MAIEGEWFTYAAAAKRLGIKADSVKRQARARGWPRRTSNDGKVQVLIPADRLTEQLPEDRADEAEKMPRDSIVDLSSRLSAAEARADVLGKEVADLREERDRLLTIIEHQASARPVEVVETNAPVQGSLFARLFKR